MLTIQEVTTGYGYIQFDKRRITPVGKKEVTVKAFQYRTTLKINNITGRVNISESVAKAMRQGKVIIQNSITTPNTSQKLSRQDRPVFEGPLVVLQESKLVRIAKKLLRATMPPVQRPLVAATIQKLDRILIIVRLDRTTVPLVASGVFSALSSSGHWSMQDIALNLSESGGTVSFSKYNFSIYLQMNSATHSF